MLLDDLSFLNDLRYTKITNLYSLFAIQQNIIQFDISMNNRSAMNMSKSISYLFEYKLGITLLQLPFSLDKSQKITPSSILHNHEQMLGRLKHLQEPDNIRMLYLFQEVYLLKYFSLREIILHIIFLDGLDGYLFAG